MKFLNKLFLIILVCIPLSCTKPSSRFIKFHFHEKEIEYNGYFGRPGESMENIHMEIFCDQNLQIRGYYTKNNGPRYALMGEIEKERRRYILRLNELNNALETTGGQFVISKFTDEEIKGIYWGPIKSSPHEYASQIISLSDDGNQLVRYRQRREVYLIKPRVIW